MRSLTPAFLRQKLCLIASSCLLSLALVACNSNSASTANYSIGGTLNGLAGSQTVVLQNNAGDDITLNANGNFTFATTIASGAAYNVTVKTQPNGQNCTASVNSGTVSANVSSVLVSCVNVVVLKSLSAVPKEIRYSQSTDQFVFTTNSANTLHIVNPFTGADRTVELLAEPKRLQLSPDGKLAAVLYGRQVDLNGGRVDLIDVTLATRIRTSELESIRSDVLLLNSGEAYLLGGDQWDGTPSFINARTGALLTPIVGYAGTYWGFSQFGVVADKLNSLISISAGLSPSKLTKLTYDPLLASTPTYSGDWPYHGDYYGAIPIGFNSKQSLVFTDSGLVAYTSNLTFAAQLNVSQGLRSVSASADDSDLVITLIDSNQPDGYADKFSVIDPTLLLVQSSVPFPTVESEQSYGGAVFHTLGQRRVAVVRTGDASQPAKVKMWTYIF